LVVLLVILLCALVPMLLLHSGNSNMGGPADKGGAGTEHMSANPDEPFELDGQLWLTSEHYYQAHKFPHKDEESTAHRLASDIKPNTAPCLDDDSSSAWLSSTSCADLASLGWCTTGDYISQTSQRCPESCSLFTHIPACTAAAIKSVQMRANMAVSSSIDDSSAGRSSDYSFILCLNAFINRLHLLGALPTRFYSRAGSVVVSKTDDVKLSPGYKALMAAVLSCFAVVITASGFMCLRLLLSKFLTASPECLSG